MLQFTILSHEPTKILILSVCILLRVFNLAATCFGRIRSVVSRINFLCVCVCVCVCVYILKIVVQPKHEAAKLNKLVQDEWNRVALTETPHTDPKKVYTYGWSNILTHVYFN
jgi:Ca2+/H+ antiporter